MSKGKKGGKRITRPLMEQKLEAFFRSRPGEAIPFKEVFRQLRLDTHPMKMLAIDVMEEMAWDDFLVKVTDSSYKLADTTQVMEGVFQAKPNGRNTIIPDGGEHPIFVAERNSMSALTGDRVKFCIMARKRSHIREAQVIEIIERKKDQFVGRLEVDSDLAFLLTQEPLAMNIIIPKSKLKGGKTGDYFSDLMRNKWHRSLGFGGRFALNKKENLYARCELSWVDFKNVGMTMYVRDAF